MPKKINPAVKFIESLNPKTQETVRERLDQYVHDAKASEASNINNEGIEAQLAYLELGADSVLELLK